MDKTRKIERKQIQLIKMGQAKLKLSDADYRTMLSDRYWVSSCKELSYKEASDLIDHMKTLGFKIVKKAANPAKKKATAPNITHLMTREQLEKIEHLKQDIRWRVFDGYRKWLTKYLKKDHITTLKEASCVIEALKQMRARQQQDAEAQRGQQFYDRPASMGGRCEW